MKIKLIQKLLLFALLVGNLPVFAQQYKYTTNMGVSGNYIPFGVSPQSWDNYRSQFLYLPGTFPTAPSTPFLITKIYFQTYYAATGFTMNNFKVSMGNTTATSLSGYLTGLTVVRAASTYTAPTTMNANDWFGIDLATPILIDPTKPFVIDVEQTGGTAGIPVHCNSSFTTTAHAYGTISAGASVRSYSYALGIDIITCSTAVTTDPVPVTTCEAEDVTFSMAGQDIATYQWQTSNNGSPFSYIADGTLYSGTKAATLTVKDAPFSANGNAYRCIIAKPGCKDTTKDAVLAVNGLVKLDPLPGKDTTCISSTEDLVLKSNGSITGYRWQVYVAGVGYIDVPHAPPYDHLGHILRITGVPDTLDGSKFRCIVDGICDTATSTEMYLTVNPVPAVGVPPADTFVKPGMTAIFMVQATAAGARYQWQAATPTGNFVNLNEGGIYAGVKNSVLVVKGVSTVQNNFRFRCIVLSDLMCNSPGDTSDEAVLTVDVTSVKDIDGQVQMIIYPNPTNASDLFIAANESFKGRKLSYRMVDKMGRVVATGKVDNDNTRIDVSKLPADVYMIQLTEEGKMVAQSKFTRL